ncbi:MAG: phospholipase C [Candidatus Dormibacteria bacterium]
MITPSRRAFIKGSAAGTAALGLGDFQSILRSAMAAPACGSPSDIEHVVILMQENHSFDQYFGRYKGVRGFDDRSVRLHAGDDGTSVFRQASPAAVPGPHPLPPFRIDTAYQPNPLLQHEGDCIDNLGHQWADEHAMWNSGAMDGWMARQVASVGPGPAATTMGYYDGSPARDGSGELDLYWALADNFTTCDNYYSSVLGGTDANRLYSMSGTIDPDCYDGGGQFLDTVLSGAVAPSYTLGAGGRWIPYTDALDAHRSPTGAAAPISWKVYGAGDQLSPESDNSLRFWSTYRTPGTSQFQRAFVPEPIPDFLTDAALGNLPQVSWILLDNTHDEHPPAPSIWGQAMVGRMVSALMSSPLWAKSAMFLTFDENGGFFDHVPPPTPPSGEPGEFLDVSKLSAQARGDAGAYANNPIGLGFRVPTLVVSPFSRNPNPAGGPMVCSDQFDHTSTLKFVERVFGAEIPSRDAANKRPGLSAWRRDNRNAGDLTSAFNFAGGPLSAPGSLPVYIEADPRTLTECPLPVGSLAIASLNAGYPVPAEVPFPVQEASAGRVLRPSGVCAASTSTTPSASGNPVNAGNGTPATSTAGSPALDAVAALAAGGILAAAWWSRRRAAAAAVTADPPGSL